MFITYAPASGGYQLQVPQGCARTVNEADVRFVDKFGGVQVSIGSVAQAPTAATTPATEVTGKQICLETQTYLFYKDAADVADRVFDPAPEAFVIPWGYWSSRLVWPRCVRWQLRMSPLASG